jgi:lipopolysaccharide export system ATP-binding protein
MSKYKNKPKLAASNSGLKIKNIRKSLSKKPIVRDVSINVERGKAIGLLGQNGAGKTTTFYMTMGLINPDGGGIYLDDNDITSLPMYKRARLGLGYLPQQPSIFRGLSVEDNIFSILETQKHTSDQMKNLLEELLTEFSLTHLRRAMPYNLSGGERRRTEIARCLASNPKIILMDEPFAGVDPIGINDIKELIKHLTDRNIGVLITDHQSREVLDTCEYSYIMHSGEIISEGTSDHIISDQDARKFYLGQGFKV